MGVVTSAGTRCAAIMKDGRCSVIPCFVADRFLFEDLTLLKSIMPDSR